jgi:outer membrane protein TolC
MKPSVLGVLFLAVVTLAAENAHALQPIELFLEAARKTNPDTREARANTDTVRAQSMVSVGRLLPGLSLRGTYSRNQYETAISLGGSSQAVTITPYDQFDGVATITVPLVNLADYWRADAAGLQTSSSKWQEANIALQVESRAVQAYYQIVADLGLVAASERALDVAKTSLALAQARFQSGKTAAIDVDRAEAEVERQVQQLAAARFQLEVDERSLRSLTGIAPDTGSTPALQDDLHEEPPLDTFQTPKTALPSVVAAMAARRAQEQQALVQRLTLLPALAGSFAEKGTNAPGFTGHEWSWQAMLSLTWGFDLTSLGNIRAQDAQLSAATAREERARVAALDSIHRAWNMVQTDIARSRSARKQAQVSRRAADLARDRYTAGAATQLDLLQAERDAFSADTNQIQTDADLANARAQLILAAGRSLVAKAEVTP